MGQSKLEYALAYAAIGWAVLPLHSINADGCCSCGKPVGHKQCKPGKHPRLFTGLKEASKDPEKINTWWRQWPDANIGIVTGAISGMWALDVDVGPDKLGGDSLDKLLDEHGPLPETVTAMTGGGGEHYVFAYPDGGVRSATNVLGRDKYPDIDSRGDGGYIIVEPSNHISGGEYFWEGEADPLEGGRILPAPEWLLKAVSKKRPETAATKPKPRPKLSNSQQKDLEWIRLATPFVGGINDRDRFIQVGMALHDFDCGDLGFGLWCNWASRSEKYDLGYSQGIWEGFRPGPVHIGTFFELAKQGGWEPPKQERSAPPLVGEPAQPAQGEKPSNNSDEEPPLPDEVPGDVDDDEDDVWEQAFEFGKGGKKPGSTRNIEVVLSNHPEWRGVLGFCELSNRVIKHKDPPMKTCKAGEWGDHDYAGLDVWLSHEHDITAVDRSMVNAVIVASRKKSFHPVREYLNGLKWDGVERLSSWLYYAFKPTDDPEYLEIIGPRCLVGAVARVMEPGCKFDTVMILEGDQGKGKSTVISILFGDWFTDASLPIGDKEAQQLIQGIWGYEIAELDSFNKAEETALKAFFSTQIDRFRPSYGRVAAPHPRQTVFWGTTNSEAYLKDFTGNRRYWPVYCSTVNKAWVTEFRDQLWAEALELYKQSFQYWVSQDTPERIAEWEVVDYHQCKRLRGDIWEDKIVKFLDEHPTGRAVWSEIIEAAKVDLGSAGTVQQNRLTGILHSQGWRNKVTDLPRKNPTDRRRQKRMWVRGDIDLKKEEEIPL